MAARTRGMQAASSSAVEDTEEQWAKLLSLARATPSNPYVSSQEQCTHARTTRIESPGHARTLYELHTGEHLSCGTETVDPGCEIPMHAHESSEEVLFCTSGRGLIYIGAGEPATFEPGAMAHVPRGTPHRIVNSSQVELLGLTWTLSPPLSVQQFRARTEAAA